MMNKIKLSQLDDSFLHHLRDSIFNYLTISCDNCEICIEPRPRYCDRGQFVVKVLSKDLEKLHIDAADMFPRYYFKLENACNEIDCWIAARNITIENISKMSTLNQTS